MTRQILFAAIALTSTAAAAFAAQTGTFRVHGHDVGPTSVAQVQADLIHAEARIEAALGEFAEPVNVEVFRSRDDFSYAVNEAFGFHADACWMVGAASDRALYLLDPSAWEHEACEHTADPDHVRSLLTHEAVHALHGQVNGSDDVGAIEDLGWFTEGLASYVSGQLDGRHRDRAAQALARGHRPDDLASAWSGPYRYAVTGSMVAFIDDEWGRYTLRTLMHATSSVDAMDALGVTEDEFLDRWAGWVTDQSVVASASPRG